MTFMWIEQSTGHVPVIKYLEFMWIEQSTGHNKISGVYVDRAVYWACAVIKYLECMWVEQSTGHVR